MAFTRLRSFVCILSIAVISGCGRTKHKNNDDVTPDKPQTTFQLFSDSYTDLTDSSKSLKTVRISPDNKLFATAGFDGKIRVYDLETKKIIHILETHNNAVYRITFTKDSQRLISSSPDKTIRIYDLNQAGDRGLLHHAVESKRFEFSSYVEDFALSPDETKLIAVVPEQGLILVNIATAAVELTINTPVLPYTTPTDNPFRSAVFLPDGKSVISVNSEGVHQWDLTTGKESRSFQWEFREDDVIHYRLYELEQVTLSNDGSKLVATSTISNSHFVWDVATGSQIRSFNQFNASTSIPGSSKSDYKMRHCHIAKFNRDGTKLIGGAADEIRVWDIASMKELYRFSGDQNLSSIIYDFDVSGDGKNLIHTHNKGVRLWPLDGQL